MPRTESTSKPKKSAATPPKPAAKAPAKKKVAGTLTKANRTAAALAALEAARGALRETSRGMYELGRALAVLAQPGMSEAAGHAAGFDALVAKEFELHPQTAGRLVRAVAYVSEEAFTAMGPKRVNALLDLATVTEADDTTAILTGEVVRLWKGGPKLNVSKVPTKKIIEHTKALRARLLELGTAASGLAGTPGERAAAEAANHRLHLKGIAATVTVRATKRGAPSEFDVVGLDLRELEALTKA